MSRHRPSLDAEINLKDAVMIRIVFVLISLTVFITAGSGAGASEDELAAFVQTFFISLKAGDVEAILDHCADPLLTQKRDLLQNNRDYPEFLRQTYERATLVVNRINQVDDLESTADVEFHFPEGPPLLVRFYLKQHDGVWKIASEEPLEGSADQ